MSSIITLYTRDLQIFTKQWIFLATLNPGSLVYADDLVLLASSVCELQDMINICCNELVNIDLKLNEKRSSIFVLENVGIMNAFNC